MLPLPGTRQIWVNKPKYPMDKQVKLTVLYNISKQRYISTNEKNANCKDNHPKCKVAIEQ
jgi:hypothetical protein